MAQTTNYKKFNFKTADLGVFKDSAIGVASMLQKDCRVMGLTDGAFSLIDLIHAILNKIGKSDVIVTTWSAGIKDANQVAWMKNSGLINSFLLVTDHSYVNRQKRYAVELDSLFGTENIRTGEVHAKFTLISNDDWKICIRTSMNLNANKTCESFELDDNEEIYNFYKKFVDHTFDNQLPGMQQSPSAASKNNDLFFKKEAVQVSAFAHYGFSDD